MLERDRFIVVSSAYCGSILITREETLCGETATRTYEWEFLYTPSAGVVERVLVGLGQKVAAGDGLATIVSQQVSELRSELAGEGFAAETQTDTETVALLAQMYIARGMPPVEAAFTAIDRLEGAFALAFLFSPRHGILAGLTNRQKS